MSYNNVVALNGKKARKPHKTFGGKTLTEKVAKLEKAVKKALPEIKQSYSINTPYYFTTAGLMIPMIEIADGTAQGERDGNEVHVNYLHITGDINWSTTNTTAAGVLFFVIDKANNEGVTPIYNDHFEQFESQSSLLFTSKKRFQILKTIRISKNGDKVWTPLDFNLKINKKLTYNGTLAADYTINQVYAVFIGNSTTTGVAPRMELLARTYYTDV